jgi:hypothetical protein
LCIAGGRVSCSRGGSAGSRGVVVVGPSVVGPNVVGPNVVVVVVRVVVVASEKAAIADAARDQQAYALASAHPSFWMPRISGLFRLGLAKPFGRRTEVRERLSPFRAGVADEEAAVAAVVLLAEGGGGRRRRGVPGKLRATGATRIRRVKRLPPATS